MTLAECQKKIEKYLQSSDYYPRFVNIQNVEDLSEIVNDFNGFGSRFLSAAEFSNEDENLKTDELKHEINTNTGVLFVTGLTTFLKLRGEEELNIELNSLASRTYKAKLVVICYQCENALRFNDKRLHRLVWNIEGIRSTIPKIIFTTEIIAENHDNKIIGIEKLPKQIENQDGGTIYVITKKNKKNYPKSMLYIKEEKDSFEILNNKYFRGLIPKESGTEEQWNFIFNGVKKYNTLNNFIEMKFNGSKNLGFNIGKFTRFDENERFLYFTALKMNNSNDNSYLQEAIIKSENPGVLIRNIYRGITNSLPTDDDFWIKYDERKKLLNEIGIIDAEVSDFLLWLKREGKNAIYYLTDTSRREKEKIIELLHEYSERNSRENVMNLLEHIYPDLYNYLKPYRIKNKFMYKYFNDYKYQKVINRMYKEFIDAVEEQARKREYNLWLKPRCEIVEGIDKTRTKLYFVDAMGIEYLSFIIACCQKYKLNPYVNIGRCELPSVTEFNKEFLSEFKDSISIKTLDNIKHNGKEVFEKNKNNSPLYLIDELHEIEKILSEARNELASGEYDKICIISDHGASRLAVLYDTENKVEMTSNGIHSGRCCKIAEKDIQSELITSANGYWVLANYDRFKGSRRAEIEVHGGAALEEVAVPVIELTYQQQEIEVEIISDMPIKVSHRKKAEIKLFSKTKLNNVNICINGKKIQNEYYDAEESADNIYLIKMPEIKQAGTYCMTIYSGNLKIREYEIDVVKEGLSERDIL